jgi:hypothetical protein
MAHPGILRTPQKDAARQRWKAAAARAFSTVSQLTDIHRLAHALCGRSVSAPCSSLRLLSLALDFTARSRATFRKPDAYGQVYCHVLHMWMVKVESHREFWKCDANLLECGKCNLEFSCVPSFVPAGSGIGASRLSLPTDSKVTKYGPTPEVSIRKK